MPSRRWGNGTKSTRRYAASAASWIACTLLIAGAAVAANPAPTLDDLTALANAERVEALATLRRRHDADETLRGLSTQLTSRADARRDSGQLPLFAGCLTGDEFELAAQLKLAYASADAQTYRALASEYRRATDMLRDTLRHAQSTGRWRKKFAHLGRWISAWSRAKDPVVRELLSRTLTDQAIRGALSSFHGRKIYFIAPPAPALRAYDEYLFNLMCNADEDNLNWLRDQVATNGWFDIRRYGRAADQAAWLMVQHADGAPGYQAYIAAVLEVKARTGDTDPRNYAYLRDRIAVRSGRSQPFGTQMECVNGKWLMPEVEDPEDLDARRAAYGLSPLGEQLSKRGARCHLK